MRRSVAALMAVVVLVALAGCGGGKGSKDSASPTTRVTTTTSVTSAGAPTTASSTSAPAGAAKGSTATTAGASTSRGGGGGGLSPAAPGRYTLDQSGVSHIRGCLTQDQPAPTPVTLTVDPAQGNRQRSVRDQGDQGGRSTSVLEYRADGVYLVSLSQEQPGFGTLDFEPPQPVLALPATPTDGQRWQYVLVSKDGKYKADTTNVVEASRDQVRMGNGKTVAAVRVRSDAHITGSSTFGPVDLTATLTSWASPELRLIPKDVTDTKGSVGACKIDGHVEAVLRSGTPA